MLYQLELRDFPTITRYYSVVRNTVWQITDKDHILIIFREGRCRISIDGNDYALKEGDVFFIPAGHSYTRRPYGEELCTMTYIHFSIPAPFEQVSAEEAAQAQTADKERLNLEILSGETRLSYSNTLYLRNRTACDAEELQSILHGINLFSAKRNLLCSLQSSLALCNLLLMLAQRTAESLGGDTSLRKGAKVPPQLRRAIGYITRHYAEPIRLEELADYCSLSKQQLIRHFKTHMNTTPIQYLTDYRLARAKELLFFQPQLSIKEIAAELGFENQRYFARVFAKHNHETPSHYRDRTLNYVPPQKQKEL
ncbi:MAG: helix-turn-helix domain-containing protein [Clostridia bacterium]|nr:helix-turn-helix domain-containing protein [Clostridia bacterium]